MKKLCILLLLLLVSCSSKYDYIDIGDISEQKYILTKDSGVFFVFVKNNSSYYEFAQFDSYLRPVSKKIAFRYKNRLLFKNKGFLPPCGDCEENFYKILTMINSNKNYLQDNESTIKRVK